MSDLQVGLVGAAGRGGSFRGAFETNGCHIRAVCDIQGEALAACAQRLGAEEKYSDYAEMIAKSRLDAVVIGTPMPLHVPQAILALAAGMHVMSEVPAGVAIDECQALMAACKASNGVYMMAENYCYRRSNVVVRELARQGLFGTLYYAEGEYIHEVKELNEQTPWRRRWQTGVNGITYGTHSLGPVLQWLAGDRVMAVSCTGSGHHYRDPRGDEYENEDSCVMLAKTTRGALIKVRVDMLSERPHAMTNYQLQGTEGAYESSRGGPGDRDKIWLRAMHREVKWADLESLVLTNSFAEHYVPQTWRRPPTEALRAGHGGGDYFEVLDFVRAIRREAPCPIGIHEAMDMTLPGLISQESIRHGGAWLTVPDSRLW